MDGGAVPFKSRAQQGFLYANEPEVAKSWEAKYGIPKGLPKHVKRKPKKKVRKVR